MNASSDGRPITGGCYCGAIRFDFVWPGGSGLIPVRACGCGFCRKHGGVYTSHPEGRLSVEIADPDKVKRYRFGTKTADFHICRECGVVPVITGEIDGRTHAVVNVNTFEDVDPAELDRSPADFEGETTESRLARRQRTWIGQVTFS
ncbi:MAG: hypothetical protein AAF495_09060 [Pseudomonadota bacterium]